MCIQVGPSLAPSCYHSLSLSSGDRPAQCLPRFGHNSSVPYPLMHKKSKVVFVWFSNKFLSVILEFQFVQTTWVCYSDLPMHSFCHGPWHGSVSVKTHLWLATEVFEHSCKSVWPVVVLSQQWPLGNYDTMQYINACYFDQSWSESQARVQ